eukprot:TRINITY_DN60386_c0_g1_i1.p3 TRINITY_DN60386_c0_g1~~TRINITY_DN60386_c0_g1_i1.p3  ORF type:complete len:137 (+),score=17.48 TRINITY_DN60386_c0_g1_i1:528-938(+)
MRENDSENAQIDIEPLSESLESQTIKKDSQQTQSENGGEFKEEEEDDQPNPTILFCLMEESGLRGEGQLVQKIYVSQPGGCCMACLKNKQCNVYAHCTQRRGCITNNGQIMFYMQCNLSHSSFSAQMKRSKAIVNK